MLEPGPAQLHCVNQTLALVRGCPPRLLTRWSLPEVRRYGAVPGGFVLEGGSRCAMGTFLSCTISGNACIQGQVEDTSMFDPLCEVHLIHTINVMILYLLQVVILLCETVF